MLVPDIRETALYREAEALLARLRGAGSGLPSDACELDVSPDGRSAFFTGTTVDVLEGVPVTRLWQVDLSTGGVRPLTGAPGGSERSAKFSPNGVRVAFLSDADRAGDFQLYLLDIAKGDITPAPKVPGWIEYLHWSPDGERILLGVAGHGADIAGAQGAVASARLASDEPGWLPSVETGDETYLWRTAWVIDLPTNTLRQVNRAGTNIWEAVWCGNEALGALVSPAPSEDAWYTATLALVDISSGAERALHVSKGQIGGLAGSPTGAHLIFIEAICSDRGLIAGDAHLLTLESGEVRRIDSRGVDVTSAQWRDVRRVLLTGQRAFESVASLYDVASDACNDIWASEEVTTGGRGRYFTVAVGSADIVGVLVGEGFARAPHIGAIREGRFESLHHFDHGYAEHVTARARFESVRWRAPDGLEIHGWLMTPKCEGPHPLILEIHGGPVWHWRPRWLAREGLHTLLLLEHGYAVFWPNPRGSSGRGQAFAARVRGDLCGADTRDHLSGIDHLVAQGIADPARVGVMGRSYGGCMTAWLITQDPRFAAAVALAPHTDQVSEHLTSNIPYFDRLFLNDRYDNPGGRYIERSPVMHARKARTPTLNVCGALDRCTPPGQALEFHNALREHGVRSVLVTYPREGHGNAQFPAVIDYAARVVDWFERHMASGR